METENACRADASASVVWLDDLLCRRPELTGGKAATLARLQGGGFDVPAGFCVTTQALSAGAGFYGERVAEELQRLQAPWVARSSATAEDSSAGVFPGLFATVLGIDEPGSLLGAIQQIVASAQSGAMRSYADPLGIELETVQMAVLVQSLVPASLAGVSFSRNPVDGERRVIVEASYGLGEAVVDGSVIPDRFEVSADGEILKRSLGSKREKVIAGPPGSQVRRVATSDLERVRFALCDRRVLAVADLSRELEAFLGHPVDVEWAFAGDRLLTLQARPIVSACGGKC
jgi:pyruvate,water dikinase